jgi:hypothetical protein
MVRTVLFCSVLMLGVVAFVLGSGIDGKWKGIMHGPNGDAEIIFNFQVTGDSLSGTVSSPMGEMEISNGKVDGDNFSFDVNANNMTISHKCTLMGDSISVEASGMDQDHKMTMILTRVMADSAGSDTTGSGN